MKSREQFLVLEIAPKGTTGWFLGIDSDRNIIFERMLRDIDLKNFFNFTRAPIRSVRQKSWEGAQMFKSRRRVIVAADPRLATTIPIPLDLPRDEGGKTRKLTTTEAENLASQAMQKIFNGCRAEAARRLKIHELDTILVGAKAKNFMVDGKAVSGLAGRTGKTISLLLELTFTTREIFESLKQFFNSPDDFFFAEAPQIFLDALSRVRKLPLNLIVADDRASALYVLQHAKGGHPVLYRETLDWAPGSLTKAVAGTFAVSEKTSEDLYRAYRKGGMSEDVKRAFKRMLEPATERFLHEIGRAKVKGTVVIDAARWLQFDLPARYGGASFERQPLAEILAKVGFSADTAKLSDAAARATLYFLEAYFDKSNSEINQKLRRRLHWLKV